MPSASERGVDISAVLVGHHEGLMIGCSRHSMADAIETAEKSGLAVERLVILDRPDDATRDMFADAAEAGWRLIESDFGDQGQARNLAVESCAGSYVAFLDGDDLWGDNWLVKAHALCSSDPGRIIAHPEFNLFFGENGNIFVKPDQLSEHFTPALLRYGNFWDALALVPHGVYKQFPFVKRDVDGGFAYEDWNWNCLTLEAGFQHRVAAGTIHFKRRRLGSQTLEASGRRTLPQPTQLFRWAYGAA